MASDDDYQEKVLWEQLATRPTAAVVLETGVFSLVMILALVGNLMVCGAIYRSPRLRCPVNYYILSLALSDILQPLFVMPLSIGMLGTGRWPFTSSACYVLAYSNTALGPVSVYMMCAMAINRYFKIVRPSKYQTIFKKKFIVISALLGWIGGIFSILFGIFAQDLKPKIHPGYGTCLILYDGLVAGCLIIVILCSPYLVIFFCYYKIYSFVKSHNSNLSWQSANVEDVKIAKTLFATVIGFAILWLPSHVIHCAALINGFFSLPRLLMLIGMLLSAISSCVNPFIYGFMNRAFRKEFKKFLLLRRNLSVGPE